MEQSISSFRLGTLLADWRVAQTSGPSYARLAAAVRTLVHDGRVPVDVRLPAERDLAARLTVSRSTVTAAYDLLRAEGVLRSRVGAGSWTALPPRTGKPRPVTGVPIPVETPDVIDLTVAAPEPPVAAVLAAVERATGRLPGHLLGHGYDPAGLPALRERIAAGFRARGLPTSADQILVTAGGQGALHLLTRVLLGPGDSALVEHPTYPGALDALRGSGTRLATVGMADHERGAELLSEAVRQVRPRLAYLMADFHNPTGRVLDGGDRARVVRAASAGGAVLVVDECLVDLALDGEPLPPPVAAYDTEGDVVTIGSMSKAYWGGLRLGWLRASAGLAARAAGARGAVDVAPPILEQLVAVELLGVAEEILIQRRRQLRGRRDALVQALRAVRPEWSFVVPRGGLSLWVRLDGAVSTALTVAAERHGLRLATGSRFGADGTLERWLRVPYALPEDVLLEAVRRLCAAYEEVRAGTAPLRTRPAAQ